MSTPADPRSLTGRDALGRFGAGNPGRLPGSKNKASRAALDAVQDLYSEAVAVLKQQLRAGNLRAAEIILDHVLPKGGRVIEFGTSDANSIADLMASGEISPHEANVASQALERLKNVAEIAELEARIRELEQAIKP